MKGIWIFILILLPVSLFGRQKYVYDRVCGKDRMKVYYEVSHKGDSTLLYIKYGPQESWQTLDREYRTTDWHIVDETKDMDVTITCRKGIYHIFGRNGKKNLDRTEESKGKPWFQNIAYVCGKVVPCGGEKVYEAFIPGLFSCWTMLARDEGETEFQGEKTILVKTSPKGSFSKIIKFNHYLDPCSRELVGYKAVEGFPGTPVSVWTLEK